MNSSPLPLTMNKIGRLIGLLTFGTATSLGENKPVVMYEKIDLELYPACGRGVG